jgi:hypothetical protein
MSEYIRLDNERQATAIAADPVHVFIICPYCGAIHLHGSNGKPEGSEGPNRWGHRVDHCGAHYSAGYVIEGNPFTIHSDKPLSSKVALKQYKKAIGITR